jgi:hypothetical protein
MLTGNYWSRKLGVSAAIDAISRKVVESAHMVVKKKPGGGSLTGTTENYNFIFVISIPRPLVGVLQSEGGEIT